VFQFTQNSCLQQRQLLHHVNACEVEVILPRIYGRDCAQLGLAGEQWRANAERRAQARASLERFRSDIVRIEPDLLKQYEQLLPQLDRELGR
jgi:hypothetical protein